MIEFVKCAVDLVKDKIKLFLLAFIQCIFLLFLQKVILELKLLDLDYNNINSLKLSDIFWILFINLLLTVYLNVAVTYTILVKKESYEFKKLIQFFVNNFLKLILLRIFLLFITYFSIISVISLGFKANNSILNLIITTLILLWFLRFLIILVFAPILVLIDKCNIVEAIRNSYTFIKYNANKVTLWILFVIIAYFAFIMGLFFIIPIDMPNVLFLSYTVFHSVFIIFSNLMLIVFYLKQSS